MIITGQSSPKDESEILATEGPLQPKLNPSWEWKDNDENNRTLIVKWTSPDYNSTTEYQWTPNSTLTISSESWTLPPNFLFEFDGNNSLSSLMELKPNFNFSFPEFSFANHSFRMPDFNWTMPSFVYNVTDFFGNNNWSFPNFNWSLPDGFSMNWTGPKMRVTCTPECVTSDFPEKSRMVKPNIVTLNWSVTRQTEDD